MQTVNRTPDYPNCLKGLRHDTNPIFSIKFYFSILSKFESQVSIDKQPTKFEILCFVNEARFVIVYICAVLV